MYFDENGQYNPATGCFWTLGNAPTQGEPISAIQEFGVIGADPYFSATPAP
jgi:hypothetical protein